MFINIYHHYKFPEIQSLNHYRHNQWYHNQQRKPDGIIMNVLTKQIDQQTSTLSTTIGSPTGSSSSDLITRTQGIVIKPYMEQGVESYVQSVLESTFKTTKELIDQRRNPAIN
uniref:Uncharacterized protein n=2 Tax=Tetranychus urticae TaxID=32264 RepID=T1JUD1_TETUR